MINKKEQRSWERQIKKVLLKHWGDQSFADQWLDQICPALEHNTPRSFILNGRGQEVLQRLNAVTIESKVQK